MRVKGETQKSSKLDAPLVSVRIKTGFPTLFQPVFVSHRSEHWQRKLTLGSDAVGLVGCLGCELLLICVWRKNIFGLRKRREEKMLGIFNKGLVLLWSPSFRKRFSRIWFLILVLMLSQSALEMQRRWLIFGCWLNRGDGDGDAWQYGDADAGDGFLTEKN
jgi:hypothetical protein